MFWASKVEFVEKDNKIVLANRENGQWIRISKEVYNILDAIIRNGKDISQIKKAFVDEDV